nr:retrotransposon protein, putative, Ty1-copia subclass [Tanacetum cinerariifolium]
MGKIINELHAMLKLHEQTLPKNNVPALHAIQAGKVQKVNNKHKKLQPQMAARGQIKGRGKISSLMLPSLRFSLHPSGKILLRTRSIMSVGLRESRKLKRRDLSLYVGNGQREAVEAIDVFHLCLPSGLVIVLNNYHYAPYIIRGVISVSHLYEDGFVICFMNNTIQVSRNNMVYFSAIQRDGIFEIDFFNSYANDSSMYAISKKRAKLYLDSALLWHCRLGHISKKHIEKLQHYGLLNSTDLRAFEKCISCMSGKMARKPYTHQVERAKDLLGLIHADVCGPFKIMSRQGASYFVTFTEDFSRYGYAYLLKHKHEVFETFKVFQKEVENQLGKTIKLLRYDRGGEYMNQEFLDHLRDYRIIAHRTPPYTPQHNGVSERRNRTLLDMVRSMMSQTTLSKSFWDYVLETVARILNMVPTKKRTPKGNNGIFFLLPTREQNTSLHHEEDDLEIDEPQSDIVPIRRSIRTRHALDRMCLYIDAEEHELGDLSKPAIYKATLLDLESDKWLNAMNVEMQSMKDNKVWDLVDLPLNGKTVGSKWLFKNKTDMYGDVHTYKAHLVAKGYTQTLRIDYEETFSPVADIRSIRILIAITAYYDYEIWKMDVKTAFLNGYLSEEVYMEQPKGFVYLKYPNQVCKLKRSIYGLKQASRQWNKRSDDEIKKFGFTQNRDEPCVYLKASGSNITLLILYVDDILIMENNITMLQGVKSYLGRCFTLKDLGKAAYILGIKIYRDRSQRVSCYTDAGYLTDASDLKSHTGYVFILNGGAIDWKSAKQSIFATLSVEADMMLLRKLFREHYSLLREYAQELINQNLGTTVWIDVQQERNPESLTRTFRKFLNLLGEDLGIEANFNYAFISDRQKGLIQAIASVFPSVKHRYCVRHIYENMKSQFKGGVYKEMLWNAGKPLLKNNRVEPIFREYLMKRIVVVQKVIAKTVRPPTPSVTKMFDAIKKRLLSTMFNGMEVFYIKKWELTRIPCKHDVAVIYNMFENSIGVGIPEQWVYAAYRLETWAHVYSFKMKKSNDEIASQNASSGKLSSKGKSFSYGKCRNVGHNRKGCRGQGGGSSQSGTRKVSSQATCATNVSGQAAGVRSLVKLLVQQMYLVKLLMQGRSLVKLLMQGRPQVNLV